MQLLSNPHAKCSRDHVIHTEDLTYAILLPHEIFHDCFSFTYQCYCGLLYNKYCKHEKGSW